MRSVQVSADTTVTKAVTVRGFPCDEPDNTYSCPHFMVTPNVADLAKQWFACDTLVRRSS